MFICWIVQVNRNSIVICTSVDGFQCFFTYVYNAFILLSFIYRQRKCCQLRCYVCCVATAAFGSVYFGALNLQISKWCTSTTE